MNVESQVSEFVPLWDVIFWDVLLWKMEKAGKLHSHSLQRIAAPHKTPFIVFLFFEELNVMLQIAVGRA